MTAIPAAEDDELEDLEPYCFRCGATAGIFLDHDDAWHHFRGEGTTASPVELYDAGHAPEVAWRPAAVEHDASAAAVRDASATATGDASGPGGPRRVS